MDIKASKNIDFLSDEGHTLIRVEEGKQDRVCIPDEGQARITLAVEKEHMSRRKLRILVRRAVQTAKAHKCTKLVCALSSFSFPKARLQKPELAALVAEELELVNYAFIAHKEEPEEGWGFIEEVIIVDADAQKLKTAIARGQAIAEEVNGARSLSNTPGGDMTPAILADQAKKAVKGTGVSVKVIGKTELEKMGAGAILGVAQGSKEEPKLILLEYKGSRKKQDQPIVFVGKGVTYDTGGLSLKPADSMLGMNMDMSGGAATIHAVILAARLGIKKDIVGIVPAVENMPSGESYRPGDILKSLSGKTIEVLNTDAEGRVILADGLTYAEKYNPQLVVDAATLTGAALVALGQQASAILSADEKLVKNTQKWGDESGDYVWPLPLWEEYQPMVKGRFGDVANIPVKGKGYGGTIGGGMFLREFTKNYECPWMHIDIAPRMEAAEGDYLADGSVGAPVRLFLKIAEEY